MLFARDSAYVLQVHLRSAERLREMCWHNGGVFIKVGQHIGALDYLLPSEYVNTMKVLHQHAPESPISDIKQIVVADLGQSVEELFSSFDEQPIASASLAQVHRATRRSDGRIVAVKVQHPHIRVHSAVDMTTMKVNASAFAAKVKVEIEHTSYSISLWASPITEPLRHGTHFQRI